MRLPLVSMVLFLLLSALWLAFGFRQVQVPAKVKIIFTVGIIVDIIGVIIGLLMVWKMP